MALSLPAPRCERRLRDFIEIRSGVPSKCTKIFSGRRQPLHPNRSITRRDSASRSQLTLASCSRSVETLPHQMFPESYGARQHRLPPVAFAYGAECGVELGL